METEGVWFAYGHDSMAYPISVHNNELDARRSAMAHHAEVVFWPFNVEWDVRKIKKGLLTQEVADGFPTLVPTEP